MGADLNVTLGIRPGDIDYVQARCQEVADGHLLTLQIGELHIQSAGDGAANLLAVLDAASEKVVAAYEAWWQARSTGDQ